MSQDAEGMPPQRTDSLMGLMEAHARAWQGLASSAAAVATLPLRTLQHLSGWPEGLPEPVSERMARVEEEARALAALLEAERQAWQADVRQLKQRLADQRALVAELRQAYAILEQSLDNRAEQAREDQKLALYQTLEPLLTQLPLARHALAQGGDMAAADLLGLLGPLDTALAELGFAPIGQVGESLPFDPQWHQMAMSISPAPGAAVVVRHVGWRLGDRLLRRARVALDLRPGAMAPK